MNVREDLKRYIEFYGLSLSKFAAISGVPQPTLWRLLNTQAGCHSKTLEKLSPFLYGPDSPIVLALETADQVLEHEEASHGS